MGVYIKNMEMPTGCDSCKFAERMNALDEPLIVSCRINGTITHEADWQEVCPLVPAPEHGDLIDRDVLRASFRESIEECNKWADEVDKDTMMYARISQSLGTFVECSLRAKAAPAIIEAEEGE